VRCGKGTYIRSLARDLGEKLGCGGYIAALRRTRVGPFQVEDALSLDCDPQGACRGLLPIAHAVSGLPALHLSEGDLDRLRHGHGVVLAAEKQPHAAGETAVFDSTGELVGIARWDGARRLLQPHKVLTR
jgi:tRNA pseudouridine55 synthase